jgi:hypothetical protein
MFDISFIVGLFIFSILCFFEIIVFNEEILLTICFLSFIFFCFNTLSQSVLDSFISRGAKFESDLLASFHITKNSLTADFVGFLKLRGFFAKFKLFLTAILTYLSCYKSFLSIKISSTIYGIGLNKINELVLIQNRLAVRFQNNCVLKLLYPLISQTMEYNLASSVFVKPAKMSKGTTYLKSLTTSK